MCLITLKAEFSCAHFYRQPEWNDIKNRASFGLCFTPYGHGHDYVLEVQCEQQNKATLENSLQKLRKTLDHQHLNFVINEFKTQIPTTENLALYCLQKIKADQVEVKALRLYERPDLWVEIQP